MELSHFNSEHSNTTSAKTGRKPQLGTRLKRLWIHLFILFISILLVKGLLITCASFLLRMNMPGDQQGSGPCGREESLEREVLSLRAELQRLKKPFQKNTIASRCQLCPEKWHWFWDHCYFFSVGLEPDRKWAESLDYCAGHNASLAVIRDDSEMEFILEQMKNFSVMPFLWLGLTDSQKEGLWVWQDGTPIHKGRLIKIQWDSEERDCADLRGSGSVFASDCDDYGPWLCEKPMLSQISSNTAA